MLCNRCIRCIGVFGVSVDLCIWWVGVVVYWRIGLGCGLMSWWIGVLANWCVDVLVYGCVGCIGVLGVLAYPFMVVCVYGVHVWLVVLVC